MTEHSHIDGQTFELLMTKLNDMDRRTERVETAVTDGFAKVNGRVRRLENWRWYIVGIITAIVFILDKLEK